MQTQDGVRLDADIYYPDQTGEFPVLLMRQPYGRAIASTVVYAHPIWYAAHGYIVVIQDVRGRGSSEGEFDLFAHEIADGLDTVNWAANLPCSTGQVGMYGFSYQGMTQLYAASTQPPALKTICPSMIGYDLYHDWAYEGGAFRYQLNLGWAIQLATETARRKGDAETYQMLYAASRNLPLSDPVCAYSTLLQEFAPDSFYHDWLAHPQPDEYWEKRSPRRYMEAVDLPMLHIGGWFDTYMSGTLRFYREMAARSRFLQYLVVGPWAHLPWGRKIGAVDYGVAASTPIDRLQIRWFDQFLKGKETGLLEERPVQLFEMGINKWQAFEAFPKTSSKVCFLATTGLASMSEQEGFLLEKSPISPDPGLQTQCMTDVLVHDPWRPVPGLGGHATTPAGSFDRAALDCRTDVLTYTSPILTEDLHLVGEITVEIYCTADTTSFDLCATLSEVKPDGRVYNFTQGYLRVSESHTITQPLSLILQPICICIPKGHAFRLSLSAACFPAYPINPGTPVVTKDARLIDAQVITLSVFCGSDRPSKVFLPVFPASPS
jgi:hypothetical protein